MLPQSQAVRTSSIENVAAQLGAMHR